MFLSALQYNTIHQVKRAGHKTEITRIAAYSKTLLNINRKLV